MEDDIEVQVEDNSPSIENTLRPLSYTSWLMGVGVARPRKCPNDVYKFMYSMNRVTGCVAAYYYIYHGISQYNKWTELMDKMKKLDQKIKRETPIDDQPIKIADSLAVLTIFVCCPVSLIVHALYYYFTHPEYIYVSDLLFYIMIAQSLVNSFVFDIVVYVLCYRFQAINELIGQLDQLFDASKIAPKIRRIRVLYNSINDLVVVINDIHGLHLLLCSANCFAMAVATLFRIYMGVREKDYMLVAVHNVLWIVYVAQFGLMCWICTLARQASLRTRIIIYTFLLNRENLDQDFGVKNEINDFSIQLQQYRVTFTACNFFEMNNALFNDMVGVITVYLIILIQFYQPPKDSKHNELIHGLTLLRADNSYRQTEITLNNTLTFY